MLHFLVHTTRMKMDGEAGKRRENLFFFGDDEDWHMISVTLPLSSAEWLPFVVAVWNGGAIFLRKKYFFVAILYFDDDRCTFWFWSICLKPLYLLLCDKMDVKKGKIDDFPVVTHDHYVLSS